MATTKRTTARPPKPVRPRRACPRTRRTTRCRRCSDPETTRRYIGLAIIGLIATSAIIGIWTPVALSILERLLPSLALLCGYYYGRLQA